MPMKQWVIVFFVSLSYYGGAQNIEVEVYQLENGLTVYLNEDQNASNVFGAVWVNAGGKNDPADATGMAHYLEHMLFKGTQTLGTQSFKSERPHLDSIRLLYDQLARTSEEKDKLDIQQRINQHEVAAAEFAIPNEFDRLIKSIGSTRVNASTNYDYTNYYNFFPSNQINRWLDIYAHRFQNPVFRLFQSELETVYEEKNRAGDNLQRRVSEKFREYMYGDHPYSTQTVLGSVDHLKNPSLSKMYEYFDQHYVANNMALILAGNFNAEDVKPQIQSTFGKLRTGTVKPFPEYDLKPFEGREVKKVRITPIKAGFMGYKLVPTTHPDRAALDMIGEMMSNQNETGFIDEMTLNSEVIFAGGNQEFRKDDGSTFIFFVPKIFGKSLKKFEERIRNEFKAIADGEFSDDYFASIKNGMYKNFNRGLEDLDDRAWHIGYSFITGVSWETYQSYNDKVRDLTKEDVMAAAEKYFGDDYFVLQSRTGFPKKVKLKKPPYKPVINRTQATSEYAQRFQSIPELKPKPTFLEFQKDLTIIDDYIYHTHNPLNDIFTLRLRIAKSMVEDKMLPILSGALDASGTQKYTSKELKQQFANLGASFNCFSTYNSFEITVTGLDDNFWATMDLVTHLLEGFEPSTQTLKYIANQRGTDNKLNKNNPSSGGRILYHYGLFGEHSASKNRIPIKEVAKLPSQTVKAKLKEVIGEGFTSIHYVGQLKSDEVVSKLREKDTFKRNKKDKFSFLEARKPAETTIYLVNDKKAIQSYVYYIVNGEPLDHEDVYRKNAFNAYYTNSLSGLLFQEVREFRSLAYATAGNYIDPVYEPEKSGRLVLFTGSQADKTTDAVEVVLGLIRDMPAYKERLASVRDGLILSSGASKPDFRSLSTVVESQLKTGFTEDPNAQAYGKYPEMTFEDIQRFYEENIKGKPVTVTIYGDVSKMNLDKLKQFGKVVELKMDDILTE